VNWLHYLVRPLQDPALGASTGYRWFIPVHGGIASHLRSVWNGAIASALGERLEKNFCWGGSTAIRRETFNQRNVLEYWQGTVSDDFALTRALHEGELPIKFVPQCLTSSFRGLHFRRTHRIHHSATEDHARVCGALVAGCAYRQRPFCTGVLWRHNAGRRPRVARAFIHDAARTLADHLRAGLDEIAFPLARRLTGYSDQRIRSFGTTLAQLTLWPLASVLYLYNALAAAFSRRITWRGINYELKSPSETVILSREPD